MNQDKPEFPPRIYMPEMLLDSGFAERKNVQEIQYISQREHHAILAAAIDTPYARHQGALDKANEKLAKCRNTLEKIANINSAMMQEFMRDHSYMDWELRIIARQCLKEISDEEGG